MITSHHIVQAPAPGQAQVCFCGDCIRFELTVDEPGRGTAWIRTNLGRSAISRREIIERIEQDDIKLHQGWYDIQMTAVTAGHFSIRLPLHEVGHFQAKCFFLAHGSDTPVWPAGDNVTINVEPAGTCCSNIIYNAFVRQFGESKSRKPDDPATVSMVRRLDEKGYTVIPPSGKFRDLKKEIKFIFSKLGCRILHLLPVHPTPTTYARMGRFGSPYAALNFTDVDPALAEFDPAATPLEQFMELADMVHYYNGYLFMDIAINHTGWAAAIHERHPEWLLREDSGEIIQPQAWGVVWADLTRLDYSHKPLWQYMADMFILWCQRGVDGFRCDAGYMIPVEAWEYIVAKVRTEYPGTLFLLEGLGGPIRTTCNILNRANFNWAYSELFQNYTPDTIIPYLSETFDLSWRYGHFVHFAETHDNNRLASVSKVYAKMRTGLCAMFSVCGGFGFANGVEWFADQKIDVHESASLNWGARINQVDHIRRLNLILKIHPCFFNRTHLSFIPTGAPNALILLRQNPEYGKKLLILVNLDCDSPAMIAWHPDDRFEQKGRVHDLITGTAFQIRQEGGQCTVKLMPGEVLALTGDPEDLDILKQDHLNLQNGMPQRVYIQKLKAMMLGIHTWFAGLTDLGAFDLEEQTLEFADNPIEYIRKQRQIRDGCAEAPVVVFDCSADMNRQVMVPPGFFLMVVCDKSFRARITNHDSDRCRTRPGTSRLSFEYKEGLLLKNRSRYFTVFHPTGRSLEDHLEVRLNLRIFDEKDRTGVVEVPVLVLAEAARIHMDMVFRRKEILAHPSLKLLGTSHLGAAMRALAWWGKIESRYDALLAANLNPDLPENRWILLARCRMWAVYQDHSVELTLDCLETFTFTYGSGGRWLFHVPTSEGKFYPVELTLTFSRHQNHVRLRAARPARSRDTAMVLDDQKAVHIIIRPDIESRSFHDTVKAWQGPEEQWARAVESRESGFTFQPDQERRLTVRISKGSYQMAPEWHYMVHRPLEAQRGLDPESDLFSPGYFRCRLLGDDSFILDAQACADRLPEPDPDTADPAFEPAVSFETALYKSLDAFIVHRGKDRSVIAGYPWFLDWGRDSLIFSRSLIELGRLEEARAILRLFGRFEQNGTLPNMICGEDAGNRETSDAPLWFAAAVCDLVEKEKSPAFLDEKLDNRTVRQILLSMGHSLISGTPTGVAADPDSALLYSPSHFTWMDTNFPAGTPRQGYPIEIQALWCHALDFFSRIDVKGNQTAWQARVDTVRSAIVDYFYQGDKGYFSDCCHCDAGQGVKTAVADDALRPNQLFLITLNVITDPAIMQSCVEACMALLVPAGIRSLSNRRVSRELPVVLDGVLLNDPFNPYQGKYEGDEDRARKPAYHNGTAWTWLFPVFCEAWAVVFGPESFETVRSWLSSAILLMRKGAAGYIPEILDGDVPHTPRGCDAQAWGCSEFARVFHKLSIRKSGGVPPRQS